MIISFMTIRRAVGILGIILPIIVSLGGLLFDRQCRQLQASISDYYYTVTGSFFVGTLCAVGLFLYTYRGYDPIDNILSSLAGVFAVGIAFFPTDACRNCLSCNILTRDPNPVTNTIHYICAAAFFLILAYMSLFLFTRSDVKGKLPAAKRKRNIVYRISGIVMVIALILILSLKIFPAFKTKLELYHPVFWFELIALWSFGTSWLTKGLPG